MTDGYRIEVNRYGWVCPRCHRVWAPWVVSCSHHDSETVQTTSGGTGGRMIVRLAGEEAEG